MLEAKKAEGRDGCVGDVLAGLGHVDQHEAGVDGHDHLVLDLGEVLGEGVDGRADLPRHGDGVLGVAHAVVGGEVPPVAHLDHGVVDDAGAHRVDEVDDRQGRRVDRILRSEKTDIVVTGNVWPASSPSPSPRK